jgi:hypothetical protein
LADLPMGTSVCFGAGVPAMRVLTGAVLRVGISRAKACFLDLGLSAW